MQFSFRRTQDSDYSFYSECFHNDEFQYMMYGSDPLKLHQLEKYISRNDGDLKFVVSAEDRGDSFRVGFAHFYLREDGRYSYVGGLHPAFFNSGIGVLASVAAISLFFDIYPNIALVTGIFKHNTRSLKIHLSLGFKQFRETEEKTILALNKEDFNNDFVRSIRTRIDYRHIGD